MGRRRKFGFTQRGQELFSRQQLQRQGLKVAPYVSFEKFEKRWQKEHKGMTTPDAIIREFWGDYITSDARSLDDYFERISKES